MKTFDFNFKIQDCAQMVYEEDYDDLNGTEQNLVRIIFNNIRREILHVALDTMDIKSTPLTLMVAVPEAFIPKMLLLVIDLVKETRGEAYLEDIESIVDLHQVEAVKFPKTLADFGIKVKKTVVYEEEFITVIAPNEKQAYMQAIHEMTKIPDTNLYVENVEYKTDTYSYSCDPVK